EQNAIICNVIETLFDRDVAAGVSIDLVLEAWQAAGREKRTPMTENEVNYWLSYSFPSLPPAVGSEWIKRSVPSLVHQGWSLFFTSSDTDMILSQLYQREGPADLSDFCDGDIARERALRVKLKRDLRFIFDDHDRVYVREASGFIRATDQWHVELADVTAEIRSTRVSLDLDTLSLLV